MSSESVGLLWISRLSPGIDPTGTDQRKTLLQPFIREIVLAKDRKVEQIEIRIAENVEAHLAEEAATGSETAVRYEVSHSRIQWKRPGV